MTAERALRPAPRRALLATLAASLAAFAYSGIGTRYYDGFHLPAGRGLDRLPAPEAVHLVLFAVFGLATLGGLWLALMATRLPELAARVAEQAARRWRWGLPLAFAALALAGSLGIARSTLGHAVVTDDEHVYRFIAQTLRTGSVTAPSPGSDLEFYREQFVVLDEQARYGKYTIGQPLLLAVGQALNKEAWVVPLTSALCVIGVFLLGRLLFDDATGLLASLLCAASPQQLLTGATLLSQPASAACLVLGVLGLAAAERAQRPGTLLLLAGGAFGFGAMVRPLPGLIFCAAALLWCLWPKGLRGRLAPSRGLWVAALPLACGLVLLAINHAQSGAALQSGQQAFHDRPTATVLGRLAALRLDERAMSVVGSLLRLDVWLLGVPGGLLLCLWARAGRARTLLGWFVLSNLAYRVLVPKVGVAATGSLYLHECVPLLCLLAADGLMRVAREEPAWARGRGRRGVAAFLAAVAVVSVTLFVPLKLEDLARMARAQNALPALLRQQGVRNAVVFHTMVVPPWLEESWAYSPPINSPGLEDDVLYLWLQFGAEGVQRSVAFWQRRYPARSAWMYLWLPGDQPRLLPLLDYAEGVRRGQLPVPMKLADLPDPG